MNHFVIIFLIFFALTRNANAYLSTNVMVNCAMDYFEFCSKYPVNGDEVKDCFREVGSKLRPMCIKALEQENMITEEDRVKAKEEIEPVEEPAKVEDEIQPFGGAPVYKESQITKIKENIKTSISRRVAKFKDKIKQVDEGCTLFGTVCPASTKYNRYVNPKVVNGKKVQSGGKWDGFPLYLDWKSNRKELGGELTPYGLEDRN